MSLNILRESMIRWWRRKLTGEFSQSLRQSSDACKQVGSRQGIRGVAGEYA